MFDWLYEIIEAVKNYFNLSQPVELNKELDIIFDIKKDFKLDTESFKIKHEDLLKSFMQSIQIPTVVQTSTDIQISQMDKSMQESFANKGCIVYFCYSPSIEKFSGDFRSSEDSRNKYADSMKPYANL
mgnify:CR=1|tara:strand:+ start:416 stop:799 length:384 start_codon:yes stop_codon:yes gene_type:complete